MIVSTQVNYNYHNILLQENINYFFFFFKVILFWVTTAMCLHAELINFLIQQDCTAPLAQF